MFEQHRHPERDHIDNLVPCQRLINHHKSNYSPAEYKHWKLKELHKVIAKLPKHPFSEREIRRKEYYLFIANHFGITPEKPFDMMFYYERIGNPPRYNIDV